MVIEKSDKSSPYILHRDNTVEDKKRYPYKCERTKERQIYDSRVQIK